MNINAIITEELQVKSHQVDAAVKLIDEGCAIPFISRYRKEATGALNDEQLRKLSERLTYLRNLDDRKSTVTASIEEQGKMTPELKKQIDDVTTMVALEDLYRPYKQKKRTRAAIARERGLDGLAMIIRLCATKLSLDEEAAPYVNPDKEVPTIKDAVNGALDIIAEEISDNADFRAHIRNITFKEGLLVSSAKDSEAESVYEGYYDFTSPVSKMTGYRTLAINRGEKEKFLTVKIEAPVDKIISYLEKHIIIKDNPNTVPALKNAIADSYARLIAPSIERDIRSELTSEAEDGAITVFGKNLEQLLMQPPITGQTVLGWDPAFRTGCKLAVSDPTGKILDTVVIYPTAPQNKVSEAKAILKKLIAKYNITLISCGNGTASRESEAIISDLIKEIPQDVHYVIVNEAGASVYSASELASKEFPQFDVNLRSAVSIARRLQDPLAELVKIDPKAIGVGQYQHDMPEKELDAALGGVVESCVNAVGVDLNTASPSLLKQVAGLTNVTARNIVTYREENGAFTTRKQLLKVPKLGPKAFEQCAGFLRVPESRQVLDHTGVHPESYAAAEALLKLGGYALSDVGAGALAELPKRIESIGWKRAAEQCGCGEMTLRDIVKELLKPGRDPRDELPAPILRTDVLDVKDLKPGMVLTGTVRNVIDFGVFVDIGVHQDGLVHISKVCDKFIKHPSEAVSVGDVVKVVVLEVDEKRKRISLSMRDVPKDAR